MKTHKLFTHLLPLLLLTAQASQQNFNNHNTNLQPEKQDLELQKGIEKYLPQFFQNNQQMLEKMQEGQRQSVVLIGATGAGKSTLIGGLLGHKLETEEKEVIKRKDDTEEETDSDDDMSVSSDDENNKQTNPEGTLFVNKTPGAPTIGHSTTMAETIFPTVYLDPKSNLAFIDTAGLGDTRRDGPIINLCSALSLRSLIEKIGGIKCIIGVINYQEVIVGRNSTELINLFNVTNNLLKNKPYETLSSSIILAFTHVPKHKKKKNIKDSLKIRYNDLLEMKEKEQTQDKDELAIPIYKALFPTCCNIKNKNNVPFVLISPENLLKQNRVRKHMLPKLKEAKKIDSKDIGLVLEPYLLQKTRDWLVKRAQSMANDIRSKKYTEGKIINTKKYLAFNQKHLSKKQDTLKNLTAPNNKDKKETFKKCLNETIQNNTQRLNELDLAIKDNKQQQKNKLKEIQTLNTNEVILYTRVWGSYDKNANKYYYDYNNTNVPIDYINYNDPNSLYNTKEPKAGHHVTANYKVIFITKNYDQGQVSLTLENNLCKPLWAFAGIATVLTFGVGSLAFGPVLTAAKYEVPKDFHIYAQKKHIYHNHINTLKNVIKNLKNAWLKATNEQKHLKVEIQLGRYQLQQLQSNNLTQDQLKNNKFGSEKLRQAASNLLQEKQMIEQIKTFIKDKKQVINNIENELSSLYNILNLLNGKIKRNAIIPYIITQLKPFIKFHNCHQHNLNTCTQYMNNLKQNNQHINTNNKHIDYQPGLRLDNNYNIEEERKQDDDYDNNNNNNSIHIDYQSNGELEQKEDDYCDNNNNNNSSSLTSSLLLGTTLVSGSLLKKKN